MFTLRVSEVKGGALSLTHTWGHDKVTSDISSPTIVNILLENKKLIRVEKYINLKCEIFHR